MAVNHYHDIFISDDFQEYDFVSSGKQIIKKRIKFELIDELEQVYNLSLCTVLDNGKKDYQTASKNGDMVKILETIGIIALKYTDHYPERKIYFTGSDNLRTRQYELSIFSQLNLVLDYFTIEGITVDYKEFALREDFKTGKNYNAFIFTRRH